jgi:hypothetical protein
MRGFLHEYHRQSAKSSGACWPIALAAGCWLTLLGCEPQAPANNPAKPAITREERIAAAQPQFPGPTKMVVYQPVFRWQDRPPSAQGTGFFAKAPNGKTVAVSSAHFLKRNGPPLLEAVWTSVITGERVAGTTKSWGSVGRAGTMNPEIDLRSDYLLMPVEDSVVPEEVLEFDLRSLPAVGERVWLPDKDPSAEIGHHNVAGTVTEATEKYLVVELDVVIKLQSQSGSPFLSQTTGKVLGTLSTADVSKQPAKIYLTPAAAIVQQLSKLDSFPELRDEVGLSMDD